MSDTPATVTVRVWSGATYESYDDITARSPDEYEMEVVPEDTYYVPHEDHVVLAEDIDNHAKYGFHVTPDESVELIIETNDSHHSPVDAFDDGRPVEGGLFYAPEGHTRHTKAPFKTEMWGRIRMRVEDTTN